MASTATSSSTSRQPLDAGGHSFSHELQVAADAGLLGSIDANRGDPQNGWDTDQFPTDLYQTTEAMMIVLQAGG